MSMDDEFLESRERRHAKESGLQRPVNDLVHGVFGAVRACWLLLLLCIVHVHVAAHLIAPVLFFVL